jgi:hypothetical protein
MLSRSAETRASESRRTSMSGADDTAYLVWLSCDVRVLKKGPDHVPPISTSTSGLLLASALIIEERLCNPPEKAHGVC